MNHQFIEFFSIFSLSLFFTAQRDVKTNSEDFIAEEAMETKVNMLPNLG